MSALAGTISAPFAPGRTGFDAMRFLRPALSLAIVAAVLSIALPMAFGAGTRSAGADPLQVFSSGPAVDLDASGAAQLSIAGLVPGQGRTATIRVSNGESEAVGLTLATHLVDRVGPGGEPLSSALSVRIASASGKLLYAGPLAGLGHLRAGRIGPGQTRAFDFAASLPADVGNEVEGSKLSAAFSWTAG